MAQILGWEGGRIIHGLEVDIQAIFLLHTLSIHIPWCQRMVEVVVERVAVVEVEVVRS